MLYLSVLLTVWFVAYLYFTKRKDEMMQLILSTIFEEVEEDETENDKNEQI